MGESERVHRLGSVLSTCPRCGLPREQVQTLEQDPVMLEPGMRLLAHRVPAERRWIELSDGRVTVYGVNPVDGSQRCRIEHALACPGEPLPDLWPWLTTLREENARKAARLEVEPPASSPTDGALPDVG